MIKTISTIKWIVFVSIILTSCSTSMQFNPDELYGKYQYNPGIGVREIIILKSDKTFQYNWQQGLISGKTKGAWELEQKRLILHSEKQAEDEVKYRITPLPSKGKEGYEIIVTGFEGEPLGFAVCKLKKGSVLLKEVDADENGICQFPLIEGANTLEIAYLAIQTSGIPLNDSNSSSLNIQVKWQKDYYQYFTKEEWKIKGKRIYNPNTKNYFLKENQN